MFYAVVRYYCQFLNINISQGWVWGHISGLMESNNISWSYEILLASFFKDHHVWYLLVVEWLSAYMCWEIVLHLLNIIVRGPVFPQQILTKFHGTVCGIPQHYYPQIPYILRPVGVVVLTDDALKYKEFIVTCNTKTHYIRPWK